jgi:RHS repeat-associated protein
VGPAEETHNAPVRPGSPRSTPGGVAIQVADRATTARARVTGLLLSLRRTDSGTGTDPVTLAVDYSGFRNAYGGDWADRLRLEVLPACAITTPDRPGCQPGTPLPTRNDTTTGVLSAQVPAAAAGTVLAADAGPAGPTGDFKATDLAPSGKWAVATQGGDFTWSYPIATPPVPGGTQPDLSLSYSANAIDGHTASTNNQASWIGDGWSLSPGYIERGYKSCATEDIPLLDRTADQCWGRDNATISLAGMSTELILDGGNGNTWRPRNDDGTRVERLFDTAVNDTDDSAGNDLGDNDGEYWKITKTDGTQYYFGRNHLPGWVPGKPSTKSTWTTPVFYRDAGTQCYKPTFADSWCRQAYRWDLDYVVDPLGNAVSYFYQPETNFYGADMGKTTTKYTRGGYLLRAEYGTRDGSALAGQAPARVLFDTADRCAPGAACAQHTPAAWPDVPWDQDCASACTKQVAPSFWSTKRLSTITTQVLTDNGYSAVDSWTMDQIYPTPGQGSGAGLCLYGIKHTGLVGGTATVPEITFDWTGLANRINTTGDGLPAMYKARISAVHNESGGTVSVSYLAPDCDPAALPAPDTNTTRCFPVRWAPAQSGPINDWFVRYTVAALVQNELPIGGSANQTTSYTYEAGGGAWAYDDNPLVEAKYRSWTEWRGYRKVTVRQGDPAQDANSPISQTDHLYFQGMNGDHLSGGGTRTASITDSRGTTLTDDPPLAGFERETITRDGNNGPTLTDTINDALQRGPTATQGSHRAYQVRISGTTVRTALDAGAWRTTRTNASYDTYGNETAVDDLGDTSTPDDDRCVRSTYTYNTSAYIMNKSSSEETLANSCTGPALTPTNLISRHRSYYDNQPFGAAPVHGKTTRIEQISSFTGNTPNYTQVTRTTFDQYGRVTESFDARDKRTATAHADAHGLNVGTAVTNPLGFVTTMSIDPARATPTTVVDQNRLTTTVSYDPLGRVTDIHKPGPAGVTSHYVYTLRNDAVSSVRTDEMKPGGSYLTSYLLLDGFLRPRQTQTPAWGGGVQLTDKFYDSRGLVTKSNDKLAVTGTPGTTLLRTNDSAVAAQTLTQFDGAGRPTVSTLVSRQVVTATTRTEYHGDHIDVTPPPGAAPTTTYVDARNQQTELRQYHGPTPSGAHDTTTYQYTPAGKLAAYTDAAGSGWHFGYNLRGDRASETSPDKGTTTMTYDDSGNLTSTTDARGATVTYDYDDLNRKVDTKDGSTLLATWTYDTLSKGLLTSSTRYVNGSPYTVAVTSVDPIGRPATTAITIPAAEGALAGTYTGGSAYYPDGALLSTDLPALGDLPAEKVTYAYDGFGLPLTTTSPLASYVTDTIYTAFMEPTQTRYGDPNLLAVWDTRHYDEATRRLSQSTVEKSTGTPVVDNTEYKYDQAGNVTSIDQRAGGDATHDVQCLAYDYLRRLADAWTQDGTCAATPTAAVLGGPAPYWQTYTYDLAGDRLTKTTHGTGGRGDTVETSTYPAPTDTAPHAIRTRTVTGPAPRTDTYQYDAVGDTTSRPGPAGTQKLTWNTEQQLTSAGDSSYRYNADGGLLISRDSAGATLYLPSAQLHVDTTGHRTAARFYSHGTHPCAVRTAAGLEYEFGDNNGTHTLAVDAKTAAVTSRRMDPFGLPRDSTPVAWPDNHGFVGGTVDATAGLTRLGARDYDASLGRFVSADPVFDPKQPQHNDGYAYGANNPTTMPDPSGLSPCGARPCEPSPPSNLCGARPCEPSPPSNPCGARPCEPTAPPQSTGPVRASCNDAGDCIVGRHGPSDAEIRRRQLEEKAREFLDSLNALARSVNEDPANELIDKAKFLIGFFSLYGSDSLCVQISGGGVKLPFGLSGGASLQGCLNADAHGFTLSWELSYNIAPIHTGLSATLLLRANINSLADNIGTGWNISYDTPDATIIGKIGAQGHISGGTSTYTIPGTNVGPGAAFEVKATVGEEVAPLGTLSFSGAPFNGNTGYLREPKFDPPNCWCMGAGTPTYGN